MKTIVIGLIVAATVLLGMDYLTERAVEKCIELREARANYDF